MTTAGQLRERLAFEKRATSDDGYGNTVSGAFTEQFSAAARVLPLKGSESVMASRLEGRQPVIITVRVSAQSRLIGADWRARDTRTGAIYAITSPPSNMDEKHQYFDILATSGVAA